MSDFLKLWDMLQTRTTCFMCKKKFPKGIMKKHPGKTKPLSHFLKGDFCFHLQSTHGIPPEAFLGMIMDFLQKDKDAGLLDDFIKEVKC